MTPYIEYKGKKYEFIATFRQKRDFQLSQKNGINLKNLSPEAKISLNALMQEQRKHPDDKSLPDKIKDLLFSNATDLMNGEESIDAELDFCFNMLNSKYGINREMFDDMMERFADEYGFDAAMQLPNSVVSAVFTDGEAEQKKELPSWMNQK